MVQIWTTAEQGDSRARSALELAESPNRFLSTVQLGITLVGIFAGAFGGATLAEKLAQPLAQITWLAPYAKQVSLGFVVKALGRVPREGETVEAQGYVFEILDMDGHRVDKVLVMPAKTAGSDRAGK